jgi:hypothetical protein
MGIKAEHIPNFLSVVHAVINTADNLLISLPFLPHEIICRTGWRAWDILKESSTEK